METASYINFTFILFIVLFITAYYWYPQDKLDFQGCSESTPWCTSKNRFSSNSGLASETQIHKLKVGTPQHPLDPLTVREINKVRTILSSYEPFLSSFPPIHSLSLDEPDKQRILGWNQGDPLPPRKALVLALLNGQSHVLTVDLELSRVTSHEIKLGAGYPMVSMDDISAAIKVAASHQELNQSAIARGVPLSELSCISPSPGWYGPDEEGRRVIKVQCFSSQDTVNFYMRPLEGLTITVDLDEKEVVKFIDKGRGIPVPKATNTDYRYTAQEKPPEMEPLNPISIEQPKGPSFSIENGHIVKWANWVFHLKADQRAGMIISKAMVRDSETGVLRSVMYKGFASELFVPYMDPDENWYFKTYMDAGEFGLGATAMSLVPLNDCPRHSHYIDGIFVSSDGKPYVQPNMICVFERYAGDIGWRHSEVPVNGFEVRNFVK